MRSITKYQTRVSPYVNIDYTFGTVDLRGDSIQENPIDFYKPIINEICNFKFSESASITVNCTFRHFNTTSSRCIFQMMKALSTIDFKDKEVKVNWYFDFYDEDMKEIGEDYEELTGLNFNYYALPSLN